MPGNEEGNRGRSEEDADDLAVKNCAQPGFQRDAAHQASSARSPSARTGRSGSSFKGRPEPRPGCLPFGDGTSANDRGSNFAVTGNSTNGDCPTQVRTAQLRANRRSSGSVRSRCKKRIVSRALRAPLAAKQISHLIIELLTLLALVVFNNSASDAPYLSMMGQHMHTPIAPSKKCAQNPTHAADNHRAPERTPEMIYMESDHHTRNDEQQQPV